MDTSLSPAMVRPADRSGPESGSKRQAAEAPPKPHDGAAGTRQSARRPGLGWVLLTLLIALGLLGVLFFAGWQPSEKRHNALVTAADQVKTAPLRVAVISPKKAEAVATLTLPGEVQADRETTIYARTTGYLKAWKADIGDRVKEGQLLAEIDSPEVDIQLEQARAALKQAEAVLLQSKSALEQAKSMKEQSIAQLGTAKARFEFAEAQQKRYRSLRGSNSMNEEMIVEKEADDKSARSALQAAEAAVATAQTGIESAQSTIGVSSANIEMARVAVTRLEILKSFEKVTAPFSGIITSRKTEVGALVTAGSGTGAQALFQLANTDTVRVYVDVPQSESPSVKSGQTVRLNLREYPKGIFSGEVARTTGAIDPASRTLRTEVRVPNPTGELMAGMYAQVNLNVPHQAAPLLLPGSALIVNAVGTQVAIVRDGHVHFQPVAVEGDYGASIGISSGLAETDIVIANPSERLVEGIEVISAPAAQ